MSYQATEYVSKLKHGITEPEKNVLRSLAHYHNTRNRMAVISIPALAADCMKTERRIYQLLVGLEQKGFIVRVSGGGRSIPSSYQFPHFENPEARCRVSEQQTLKWGDLNPEIQSTKPCNPEHETLKPTSGANKEKKERQGLKGEGEKIPPRTIQSATDYSQADFDARDLRKMTAAYQKFDMRKKAAVGSQFNFTAKQVFEWVCVEAGITVQRGIYLEDHQKKWPAELPDWAQPDEREEIKNAS